MTKIVERGIGQRILMVKVVEALDGILRKGESQKSRRERNRLKRQRDCQILKRIMTETALVGQLK